MQSERISVGFGVGFWVTFLSYLTSSSPVYTGNLLNGVFGWNSRWNSRDFQISIELKSHRESHWESHRVQWDFGWDFRCAIESPPRHPSLSCSSRSFAFLCTATIDVKRERPPPCSLKRPFWGTTWCTHLFLLVQLNYMLTMLCWFCRMQGIKIKRELLWDY